MNQGNVFIVQEPPPIRSTAGEYISKDLSSASRYGCLMPILGQRDQASLTPGPCMFTMQKALREFNPDKDFLLFAGGDPMALALAMLVLRDMNIKEISVLRWDRERDTNGVRTAGGFYQPIATPLRP